MSLRVTDDVTRDLEECASDKFGPIIQHGYVVTDAEQSASVWAERTGVGPFYLVEQAVENYVFRGKRQDLTLRIAVSYWNDLQIELIQFVKGEENFYSQASREAPGRLNHYAVLVAETDATISTFHLERFVVHHGTIPSVRFAYLENYLPDQAVLELMQVEEHSLRAFEAIKAICRAWDGTRPIRVHADLSRDMARQRREGSDDGVT